MKVLLAEDDANLGFVIKDNLEMNGYEVKLCMDGENVFPIFQSYQPDICILDIMLPKKDGLEIARLIRGENVEVPILFLTSKGLKEDKLEGFKAGGDDYITKPFNIEELLMRIKVFIRRSKTNLKNEIDNNLIPLGEYNFNYNSLKLLFNENVKSLTQKEADILHYFCINKNKIIKREELLKAIWGNDDYFIGRSLDVFITKLRKYLKNDTHVEIQNLHGIGFRLEIKNSSE